MTYTTAGESHGACLITQIEGLPSGFDLPVELANEMLRLRQGGYGRGGRMKIETDVVDFLSGVLRGQTIGSPLVIRIANRDHRIDEAPAVHRPRPGHADLAGTYKWGTDDARPVLERASARETAARTAAGAVAKGFLREFGIEAAGFVVHLGGVDADVPADLPMAELLKRRDASDVYCPDPAANDPMKAVIDEAKYAGDTVGGIFEVRVTGLPLGLGTCFRREDRLDTRLAAAVMGIQAVKGVEIGMGFDAARRRGSEVHDEILYDAAGEHDPDRGIRRPTNNAGGLEGGMTNGETLVVRGAKKPISTLRKRLRSIDLRTKEAEESSYERSDICALPAAGIIGEAVVCFEVAAAFLEKFGGDTMAETRQRWEASLK
ncbi:MAG: chorismate synthase [Gemmatimonadetes bacterium]|nr:chorismate synthase [Gemmatimonadota bacterium]